MFLFVILLDSLIFIYIFQIAFAQQRPQSAAGADPWHAAQPGAPICRLPIRSTVRHPDCRMPRTRATAARGG